MTTTPQRDIEREAFEKWAGPKKFDLRRSNCAYINTCTDYAWMGWKARAAQATAEPVLHSILKNAEDECWCGGVGAALSKSASAPSDGAADARAAWISVDERLPEVGVLVLVYSPNGPHNYPDDIRIDFDCIDPNDDDHGSWLNHNEHYEHFCCVAKPEGSVGPSEKAPYTHWQPIPAHPIASTHTTTGGEKP